MDEKKREEIIKGLNELIEECGKTADESGFFDVERTIPHRLMYVVSELGEAAEGWKDENYLGKDGVFEEIADAIIRIGSTLAHEKDKMGGKTFGEMVVEKMIYNEGRSKLHGHKQE